MNIFTVTMEQESEPTIKLDGPVWSPSSSSKAESSSTKNGCTAKTTKSGSCSRKALGDQEGEALGAGQCQSCNLVWLRNLQRLGRRRAARVASRQWPWRIRFRHRRWFFDPPLSRLADPGPGSSRGSH